MVIFYLFDFILIENVLKLVCLHIVLHLVIGAITGTESWATKTFYSNYAFAFISSILKNKQSLVYKNNIV